MVTYYFVTEIIWQGVPFLGYPDDWDANKIGVGAYDDVAHTCYAYTENDALWLLLEADPNVTEITQAEYVSNIERLRAPGIQMSLHEAQILSADMGAVRPLGVRLFQGAATFDIDCYVTQDLVDAYIGGNLAIGDWVLVYFIDEQVDKAIAQQKIFKTW